MADTLADRDDAEFEDRHVGALVPAQPGTILITISVDFNKDQDQHRIAVVKQSPVIAWILDEYTEPAMPITATGHYPMSSDAGTLVMVQCGGSDEPLYRLGNGAGPNVWRNIKAARDWFVTNLGIEA